jgi:hypothetical protein
MAGIPPNTTVVPNGGYSNVAITSGAGLTYTTATGISANPWYTKQPKVNITDKDIELDGLSLRDFMQAVNEHMAIMIPNPKLEEQFEELKLLADRYRELERKLLDQKLVWETLKKTDDK